MKLQIVDKTGKKISDIELNISETVRDDIFKRAVLSENSLFYQTKGADPMAGKKQVINLSKRRKAFRTTYGRGGSRTPKKVMWNRGTQFRYVGAFAAQTVGGRKAHAPKAQKNILKMINNKEWIMALQTGVAAALNKELVIQNGQNVPEGYPFVLDSKVEETVKTKDAKDLFEKLGLKEELQRTESRKIRAGKGTKRGRKYKVKRGPLLVVSNPDVPLVKAARNIRGIDIITPDLLMVSDLGMSEKPGRAVFFTQNALEEFKEVLN